LEILKKDHFPSLEIELLLTENAEQNSHQSECQLAA
jgi:hypothetical protein